MTNFVKTLKTKAVEKTAKATVNKYGGLNVVFTKGRTADKRNILKYVAQEANRQQRKVAGLK